MGAYRVVVAFALPSDRAGLITAVYIVSYLATGIPAVIGGIATSRYGLSETALVYSLVVAALAAVAVILLVSRIRGAEASNAHELSRPPARALAPCRHARHARRPDRARRAREWPSRSLPTPNRSQCFLFHPGRQRRHLEHGEVR